MPSAKEWGSVSAICGPPDSELRKPTLARGSPQPQVPVAKPAREVTLRTELTSALIVVVTDIPPQAERLRGVFKNRRAYRVLRSCELGIQDEARIAGARGRWVIGLSTYPQNRPSVLYPVPAQSAR